MRLSLIVMRTRRSTGADGVGRDVPEYVPGSSPSRSMMVSTVPSPMRARSKTSAPASGRPAGSDKRTTYDSALPSGVGNELRVSSTRGTPGNLEDSPRNVSGARATAGWRGETLLAAAGGRPAAGPVWGRVSLVSARGTGLVCARGTGLVSGRGTGLVCG